MSHDAPVKPSKLAHFVLRTRRYQELITWYRTVLGAKPVFESPVITFLTWDSEHHRIAIANASVLKNALSSSSVSKASTDSSISFLSGSR